MKRTLAAVFICALVLLSAASAQDPAPAQPNWRTLKTSAASLWKYWNKDAKRFDIQCVPLVQQFAESAKVSVKFDEPALTRIAPMSLVIGDGAEPPLMFDLCQLALAPRYALVPEGGDRRFSICPVSDVAARAIRVDENELDTISAQEWALSIMDLGGRDPRAVDRALQPLRGISGRIDVVNDGRALMILETGTNLRRMRALIPQVDRPRDPVPLVPYQRLATSDVAKLVPHLRNVMILFARNAAIAEESVHVGYDAETGVISGMIPKALAGTLDAAIEAADAHAAKRDATAAADRKSFVQFELSAPESLDVTKFSARLRLLFESESNLGMVRFVPKDEKSPTLYVRCRPWLEAEVREAAALLSN